MAFAAAIPYIIGGLAAAGTVYGAVEQNKAAKIESRELLRQAKTEELAAAQQQIERRRSLLRSLGSLNATAGAGGVELGGSINAIAKADIRDANNDLLIDESNSVQQRASLRARAGNVRRQGTASLIGGVTGAASGFYGSTAKPKPSATTAGAT